MSPNMSSICCIRPDAVANSDHFDHRNERKNDDYSADRAHSERQRTDCRLYDDRRNLYSEPADRSGRQHRTGVGTACVLKDPTVDVAVLETARGGIIRSGLGFDHCDIGVVTNIAADHLGLKDVNTLEDLARVKSVVPRAVSRQGYAVLNAEDPLVYKMRELVDGNCVYFSMDENHPNIGRQAGKGRISCVYENGYVTILKGKWKVRVERVANIP